MTRQVHIKNEQMGGQKITWCVELWRECHCTSNSPRLVHNVQYGLWKLLAANRNTGVHLCRREFAGVLRDSVMLKVGAEPCRFRREGKPFFEIKDRPSSGRR